MAHLATFVFIAANLILSSTGQQMLDVIGAPMFAMARFPIIYQNTNSLGVMNLQRISVNEFSEVRRRSAPNLIDETVLDEIAVDDELVLMMDISDVEYFDPMTRPIGKNSPTQWETEGSGLTDDPNFMEINYDVVSSASDVQVSISNEAPSASSTIVSEEHANSLSAVPNELISASQNPTVSLTVPNLKDELNEPISTNKKAITSTKKKGSASSKGNGTIAQKKPKSAKKKGTPKPRQPTGSKTVSNSYGTTTERIELAIAEKPEPTDVESLRETTERNIPSTESYKAVEKIEEPAAMNSTLALKEIDDLNVGNSEEANEINKLSTEQTRTIISQKNEDNRVTEESGYMAELSEVASSPDLVLDKNVSVSASADDFRVPLDLSVAESDSDFKSHTGSTETDEDMSTLLFPHQVLDIESDEDVSTINNIQNNISEPTVFPKANQSNTDEKPKRKYPIRYIFEGKFAHAVRENISMIIGVILGIPIASIISYFIYLHIRRRYTGRLDVSERGFHLQNKLLYAQPLSSMTRCSEENELLVCSSSTVALPLTTSSNNV